MDDETLKRNLQNGLMRSDPSRRKSNMQQVGFQIDVGGIEELLQGHMAELKEELAKDPGDGNEAVLKRIDQLFLSLIEWVKGMAGSMSKLENSVARHTQAVANLKLPELKLEKAEWDFKVKRGPGGLIKNVEAKQV